MHSQLKARLKVGGARVNRVTELLRLHVLPVHYYSEVPDRRSLRKTTDTWARAWTRADQWDLDAQLAWLADCCGPYLKEVQGLRAFAEATASGFGPGFGPIESQVLHSVIRRYAPRRVIEVGSGVSSVLSLSAMTLNREDESGDGFLTCIEPFPRPPLRTYGGVAIIESPVQALAPEFFDQLQARDILFIDSTHTVKTGSDVPYLLLDVVPRLVPGVLVHIHDIYLPYLYRHDVLDRMFDWQESTLLAGLLTGNPSIEVLAGMYALADQRPEALGRVFPDFRARALANGLDVPGQSSGHLPSSIWLRIR